MDRQTLAAKNIAWVTNWEPVRCSGVCPANLVTTRTSMIAMSSFAQSPQARAPHPCRLTGLWPPRSSRKTTAAAATQNPLEATLKKTLNGGCRWTAAKTKTVPTTQPITMSVGERNANPIEIGTASSSIVLVLPR